MLPRSIGVLRRHEVSGNVGESLAPCFEGDVIETIEIVSRP
ncbi:hypothetical protein [Mycobacterium sp.]|jgi:hypothetical protein